MSVVIVRSLNLWYSKGSPWHIGTFNFGIPDSLPLVAFSSDILPQLEQLVAIKEAVNLAALEEELVACCKTCWGVWVAPEVQQLDLDVLDVGFIRLLQKSSSSLTYRSISVSTIPGMFASRVAMIWSIFAINFVKQLEKLRYFLTSPGVLANPMIWRWSWPTCQHCLSSLSGCVSILFDPTSEFSSWGSSPLLWCRCK